VLLLTLDLWLLLRLFVVLAADEDVKRSLFELLLEGERDPLVGRRSLLFFLLEREEEGVEEVGCRRWC
jgi:hypothetical protein